MTIMRQLGTVGEIVDIFVQDTTVETGAGLANLQISTFSSYYHRTDMTSTSSVTLVSTGTLGTWSSGQWLQINSTFMRGWYQFCVPNGMFAAGSSVAFHMYGHPSMAPVVMRYDITRFNNQRYVSSEPHNVERIFQDALVTSAAGTINVGRVGVSSFGLQVGVSTFNSRVGVSSFDLPVGVSAFALRVGVSSFGIAVGISSNPIGVNVTSYRDTAAVTTFPGYPATYFDLGLTNNSTSTVNFSSFSIAAQSVTVGSVDVTSFYGSPLVTTVAGTLGVGRVGVSSFGLPVGVSSFNQRVGVSSFGLDVGVSSMRIAVDAQIVDRLLNRNVSSGGDGGRTVAEAFYLLRNKSEISGGTLTVYHTDDTASSWAATASTSPGDPISGIDPT